MMCARFLSNDDFYICSRSRYIKLIVQLLIVLRFYALGSIQLAIADFVGVSISSVCRILRSVLEAVGRMGPQFIRMPANGIEMLEAAKAFYNIVKFPSVIGAIDCTHVRIQSPGGEHAENYRNRKGWFSLNVQTVSAADLKIISLVARWPGATHDQTIFNNSALKRNLENGKFRQFILVGDSRYKNTAYLATPFLTCNNAIESLYNESQIRTRTCVERSYGDFRYWRWV